MATLDELNDRFALGDALAFDSGRGGLARAVVRTPVCVGEAYLHGAHVTRWRPAGHDEVLWLSEHANFYYDMPIRGGVPICFPWFAGHKPPGQPNAPSHGLARTTRWDVADTARIGDDIAITFAATIGPFDLRYTATFGPSLGLELATTNTGDVDAAFEVALHSYFAVSQIRNVALTGLGGSVYEDTVGGAGTRHTQPDAPLTFDAETDSIYATTSPCTLHDPGLSRTVTVEKAGSASTVVWNPWDAKARAMSDFGEDEWFGMLCIEAANIAPHAVTLRPGAKQMTGATIHAAPVG